MRFLLMSSLVITSPGLSPWEGRREGEVMTTWRKKGGGYQDTHIKCKAPHPPSFPKPRGVARPACTLQKRGAACMWPPNTHPIFDVCPFLGPVGSPPPTQKTGSLGQFGQVSLPSEGTGGGGSNFMAYWGKEGGEESHIRWMQEWQVRRRRREGWRLV